MKEYKIDQLFREKLADRKVRPSDNAWEKLNSGLGEERKKKSWIYWSVAASVILLIGIGMLFFSSSEIAVKEQRMAENPTIEEQRSIPTESLQEVEEPDLSMENTSENLAENINPQAVDKSSSDPDPEKVNENPIEETRNQSAEITEEKNIVSEESVNPEVEEVLVAESVEPITVEEEEESIIPEKIEPAIEEEPQSQLALNEQKEESYPEITIVYKKSDTQTQKTTTFKKIVTIARDITEGEYGIGELREAKNELLAFGKRKEDKND